MRLAFLLAFGLLLAACGGGDEPEEPLPGATSTLTLRSAAFRDGAEIPERYGCDGSDVSPPLSWTGVPRRTRELALLVEDADAGRFAHWTVSGLSRSLTHLAEGRLPQGAVEADNSFGRRGWGGPCPPKGASPHRYVFALYALDAPLGLGDQASPDEVRRAVAEHSLARGTLTGRFGR